MDYSSSESTPEDGKKVRKSQTKSAQESYIARVGERYYQADEGYDKRLYENTWFNYGRITLTLIGFWLFNALHWWACFEFGIWATDVFMVYSIIAFCCSIVFGIFMLMSGASSNKIKRHYEFLKIQVQE